MTCDEIRPLLHGFVDDQLDLVGAMQVQAHLEECESCQRAVDGVQAISAALANPVLYAGAGSILRQRVEECIGVAHRRVDLPPPWWMRRSMFLSLAATVVLVVGLSLWLPLRPTSNGQMDEVLACHLRSLEASHLLDIASTDQHSVKPWFAGKLDFAPPVIDLAGDGFPLIGGRLDYLQQRQVAGLVYRRGKHVINVLVWPGETTTTTDAKNGFNLIRFPCEGMICWAISDLNAQELEHFVELFEAQRSASTRS